MDVRLLGAEEGDLLLLNGSCGFCLARRSSLGSVVAFDPRFVLLPLSLARSLSVSIYRYLDGVYRFPVCPSAGGAHYEPGDVSTTTINPNTTTTTTLNTTNTLNSTSTIASTWHLHGYTVSSSTSLMLSFFPAV